MDRCEETSKTLINKQSATPVVFLMRKCFLLEFALCSSWKRIDGWMNVWMVGCIRWELEDLVNDVTVVKESFFLLFTFPFIAFQDMSRHIYNVQNYKCITLECPGLHRRISVCVRFFQCFEKEIGNLLQEVYEISKRMRF